MTKPTSNKISDKKLSESELRYRSLYETALVGVFKTRISTKRAIIANQTVIDFLGYGSLDEFLKEFVVTDHYKCAEDRDKFSRTLQESGEVKNYEIEMLRKDGTEFWGALSAKLHPEEDIMEGAIIETTNQHNSRKQLVQQEKRYRALFEFAADAVLVVQIPEGTVQEANSAAHGLLKYEDEELIGLQGTDIIAPESQEYAFSNWEEQFEEKGFFEIDTFWLTKDGAKISVEVKGRPLDYNGQTCFRLVARDVTEKRRLEEEVLHTKELHEKAQQLGKIGHWEMNHTTNLITWSAEAYRIFEVHPETKPEYDDFLAMIHPSDRENVADTFEKSIQEKTKYEINHRLMLKDDRLKWVKEIGTTYYGPEGSPERSIGTTQDISDQMMAEQELAIKDTAITNAMHAIFMSDAEGYITYANPAAAILWGFKTVEEMCANKPHGIDYWTEETKPLAVKFIEALIKNDEYSTEGLIGLRKDQSTFDVQMSGTALRDSKGNVIGIVASFMDVTELHKSASLVHQALIKGQELEKKRVALEIHDQLGGDLTGLKFGLHNALFSIRNIKSDSSEKQDAEKQLLAMSEQVSSALKFTRNLGRSLFPPILLDLGLKDALDVLIEQHRVMHPHIKYCLNCEIETEVEEQISLVIYRVVQESLTNICKYAKATEARVMLKENANKLFLSIADNGIGFSFFGTKVDNLGITGIIERVNAVDGSINFYNKDG
nr:PAS domain S-box protein [Flavobacteriales bacterium]